MMDSRTFCNGSFNKATFSNHGRFCNQRDTLSSKLISVDCVNSTGAKYKRWRTAFLFLCFLSLTRANESAQRKPSNIHQRSEEANCLIQGYHTCLLSSLSLNSSISNFSLFSNQSADAIDCFRLSRSASTQNHSCSFDECPWDDACFQMDSYNENDGFHTTENLPISTFYEDVHTIAVSFPRYLNSTVVYVLETRPASNGQTPFRFAGVSNQTTISYRLINICSRYEFRPTAILSNGSVITFLPKIARSNPPDFIVDNIRLGSLRFDPTRRLAVATLSWKHPYGYRNMDVDKYGSYLHTLECDAPSELLNEALTDTIVKTEDGATLTASFPEPMIERKCQFRFMVWADDVCGNRTLTEAKIDITLNCTTVEGYKCPASELRPHCFPHVDIKPFNAPQSEGNISVNISWLPSTEIRPQYYHVRWGPAHVIDLRRKHNGDSEESPLHHSAASLSSKSNSKEQRKPKINADFSIWMLQPETVVQEKIPPDTPYATFSNISLNSAYGVQVCAIFNGDFKRPDWPKVATNGFACTCSGTNCPLSSEIHCQQPNLARSPLEPVTTPLPTIRPPLAIILGLPQPPDSLDTISNFTQTLLSSSRDGLHLQLNWQPPKNLLQEQLANYDTSIKTLVPCEKATVCCDYAASVEINQTRDNQSGVVDLFVPDRVLHSNCELIAKITTTAINGASSVSLKNIQVPPPQNMTSEAILKGEPKPQFFDYCHAFGCKFFCMPNGDCICSNKMPMKSDRKECDYQNSNTLSNPASPTSNILCATEKNKIFTWSNDGQLQLHWKINSTLSGSLLPHSLVHVRFGSVSKRVENRNTNKFDNDAIVASTNLASSSIDLTPSKRFASNQLGVQFCIQSSLEPDQADSKLNWDIVPIVFLPDEVRLQPEGNVALDQTSKDYFKDHLSKSTDNDPSKTIIMAVIIPLSCVIIISSLIGLICYFRSSRRPSKSHCPRRREATHLDNGSTDKPKSMLTDKKTGAMGTGNSSI